MSKGWHCYWAEHYGWSGLMMQWKCNTFMYICQCSKIEFYCASCCQLGVYSCACGTGYSHRSTGFYIGLRYMHLESNNRNLDPYTTTSLALLDLSTWYLTFPARAFERKLSVQLLNVLETLLLKTYVNLL